MTQTPPRVPPIQTGPPRAARGSSALAVAALVLGCCAAIPIAGVLFAVLAVVFAIIAMARRTPGRGLAVGAILVAVGMLLVQALVVAALVPSLRRSRELARRTMCMTHLSALGKGIAIYLDQHNNASPPDLGRLFQADLLADREALVCPSAESGRPCDYFYWLPEDAGTIERPSSAVMACDLRGNHEGGRNVLYLDGHVRWLEEEGFQSELAQPSNAGFAAALKKAGGPWPQARDARERSRE